MEQTWLSLDGIRSKLGVSKDMIRRWVKEKKLVAIGDGIERRYLDPTPEYARMLGLAESSLRGDPKYKLPRDLNDVCLLTTREVAQIMGWSWDYAANKYMPKKKLPGFRSGSRPVLYSVWTIRDMIWKRKGRRKASRREPFLLTELIEFFWRQFEAETAILPTDDQFLEDDRLKRKFDLLMKLPSPQKEDALRALLEKTDLAKSIILALRAAPSPAASHQSSAGEDCPSA